MVQIDNLANEIARELADYSEKVDKGLKRAARKATREGAEKLRSTSPVKTGRYASGWATKNIGTGIAIYNKTRGSLTHILEKGHATRNGGRTAAQPHIRPVEQEVTKNYTADVEKVIRNG